jgi:CBS domain-containing protein
MTLLQSLHNEPITRLDLSYYCTVSAGTSVLEVIEQMRTSKRNCALVTQDNRLVGIFTDRDILRKVVDRPDLWADPVDGFMTSTVQMVAADTHAADAMALMDINHVRNVPVVSANGEVVGNFTNYAVVKFLADTFPTEIYNRPPEPNRFAHRRHGA